MLITMPTRRTLAVLISLIGLGTITHVVQSDRTPLYGVDSDSDSVREPALLSGADDDRQAAIAVLMPEDGYRPQGDEAPPPAELLALGTWPLDPDQAKQASEMVAESVVPSEGSPAAEEAATARGGHGQTPSGTATLAATEAISGSRTPQESTHGEQIASGQAGPPSQVGVISVAPVTKAAAPEVLETYSGARGSSNTDGMMDALVAAFDASREPVKAAKEPTSEPRTPSVAGTQKSAGNPVAAKASRDRAHEFLESIGLAQLPSIDKVGTTVTEGVRHVTSKARDLLGEFVAFLGVSKEDKTGASVATAPKATEKKADLGEEIKPKERWVVTDDGPAAREVLGKERIVLSATSLDDMRGGFVSDGGLKVSFGIDRATYINGNLVTMTSLNVADLGALAGAGAGSSAGPTIVQSNAGGGTIVGGMNVVQNGGNNAVQTSSLSPSALGTIIQNSLDNQKIQTVTSVNTTVNSGQMLRSISFQYSLRDALTSAARKW
jgi:hypothetical protein